MLKFVNLMEGNRFQKDFDIHGEDMDWDSSNYILEPIPNDGKRCQCLIKSDSIEISAKCTADNPFLVSSKVPQVIRDLKNINVPYNTLLDGYLSFRGSRDSNEMLSVLRGSDEKALTRQKHDKIVFFLTDIIFYNNKLLSEFPLSYRKNFIRDFVQEKEHVRINEYYLNSKINKYKDLKKEFDCFYFKDLDSFYTFRTSKRWMILKDHKTFFVVVMEMIPGKGRCANTCGSLKVGQFINNELKYISNISGMTDEIRDFFFRNHCIGKVIEIKAFERTKNGKFDEARFVALRKDLDPKNCIFE